MVFHNFCCHCIFEVNIIAKHVNAKRMTIMGVFCTQLKQTVLNSWNVKTSGVRSGVKTGPNLGGDRPPPKTYKLTLFTIIVYNSENSIRNTRPFCRPLFCHSSVVKCTSYLLQW